MKASLACLAAACVVVSVSSLVQADNSTAIKARLGEVAKSYTAGKVASK
jgi:hypothetical protein